MRVFFDEGSIETELDPNFNFSYFGSFAMAFKLTILFDRIFSAPYHTLFFTINFFLSLRIFGDFIFN